MNGFWHDVRELLRGSGRDLVAALALIASSAVLDILCMALLPLLLLTFQDPGVAAHATGPLDVSLPRLPLAALMGAVIGLLLLRAVFMLAHSGWIVFAAERVRRRLVARLAFNYLSAPYAAIRGKSVAEMVTVLGTHADRFARNVALPMLYLTAEFITVLVILVYVAFAEPAVVAVFATVLVLVGAAYYTAVRRLAERHAHSVVAEQTEWHRGMLHPLSAPREVRVLRLERHFLARIDASLERIGEAEAYLAALRVFPRAIAELLLIVSALSYVAFKALGGASHAVIVAQLSLLAFAGLRVVPSFANVMASIAALRSGRHYVSALAREMAIQAVVAEPAAVAGPVPRFESLELAGVSYQYAESVEPALKEVSLTIRRGESIGVMGPSGSGKTTLGDIVLGLLQPSAGRVLVNGQPMGADLNAWWRQVGFVPQTIQLIEDTLAANIAFGVSRDTIDLRRVQRAAEAAQLGELVRSLPRGLDSPVGDAGTNLSGGQRQRVAIARALYHERQFLVLDEATSALDSQTEREVVAALAALHGQVTTFIIAHRESTLVHCDRIVTLADGRLREERRGGVL